MAKKAKPTKGSSSPPPPPKHRLVSVFDDPRRKNVLLLTCMDQRLLDDTVRFMNGLNLQNRYDQVALAGGAMGANLLNPPTSDWKSVFFDHLGAAIEKLNRPIKDVFLLEHLDCGAYKYLHPTVAIREKYYVANRKTMVELHREELCKFAWEVTRFIKKQRDSDDDWKEIRVSYFVMDLIGEVKQLDVPKNQRSTFKG